MMNKNTIELYVMKTLTELEELSKELQFTPGGPIQDAMNATKNKPIMDSMTRKAFVLRVLKGVL